MAVGGATITGDKALDRKFKRLAGSGQRKALRAGIRASMTPIAKAMRAAINASDASPSLKREARKTVGKRFAKGRKGGAARGQYGAKVGFAVAKKKKDAGERSRPGVGVGSANIHWFVLGTKDRRTKGGHETGKIRGVLGDVTKQALASSASASIAAARKKIQQVIIKEARKKG